VNPPICLFSELTENDYSMSRDYRPETKAKRHSTDNGLLFRFSTFPTDRRPRP